MHIGVDGIDEHHARDLLAMAPREHAKVKCAEVVSNEDIRAGNCGAGQEAIEFIGNIQTTARLVGRVAPTKTGAIVGANAGKSADLWLNELPNNGRVVRSGFQYDGRTAHARTVDVKPQPTNVYEFAGGRIEMIFPQRHRELKYCAGGDNQTD